MTELTKHQADISLFDTSVSLAGKSKNEATERDLTNGRAWGHSVAWAFIVLCHALQCLDVLGLALILSKA